MKQIQLEIKALSPLAIGRQKPGGSVIEAESYLPGAVIRGAIAAQILPPSNQPPVDLTQNSAFQSLFLSSNPAIFQNAYPAIAKVGDEGDARVLPSQILVLPATALSCKTNSGFTVTAKNHGVFDTLIDRFCADICHHPYDPNCPKCLDEGRVEPFGGFYSYHDKQYYQHSVTTRLLTRVGINRRRATSEEQVLYSIEVLNEVEGKNHQPVVYRSAIFLEEYADALAEFINNHSFRLGGSASRGLGKVKIQATVTGIESQVKTRIHNFNQALQNRLRRWREIFHLQASEVSRTYFTLDLQSDAILTEDWQRTTVISPTMLQQMTGTNDPSLQLHVAYSSYDYRSGWNAAWGLMKDVELVTNRGAVYLFSTSSPELWEAALEHLENRGVGERTAEGFGQIRVCQEFHLVFRENLV